MKPIYLLAILTLLLPFSGQAQLNQPPEGFTSLCNGKDLSGWWGLKTEDPRKWMALDEAAFAAKKANSIKDINKHWRVEDGILINDGHGLFLSTEKNYGDFEFHVEYKTVAGADSGIYLRGLPQVQIWDTTKAGGKWNIGADKGSGGLWNNSKGAPGKDPLVRADKPFGEWNAVKIIMVGERVSIWLNGKPVVDHARLENYHARHKLPVPRTGPIGLQTHGGAISWKNVFIREIGSDEANSILLKGSEDGYASIFDGASFKGWKGPIQNYEVVEDAIRCKKGKGGTIYTEESYADIKVRFEFLLPPGGNNGLALRYPGKGNTAYVGMCELQVLDSEHKKYAKLDKRQYHGSAYGMAAAHRGYLHPTGEWNYQEVTIKGHTLLVELNGNVILNTDLSKITDYMAKSAHPGKMLSEGHFGFAGHSDAVSFRNIAIKKLN